MLLIESFVNELWCKSYSESLMKIIIILLLCLFITDIQAEEHENSFVNKSASGKLQVWNPDNTECNDIEFKKNGAKSWGSKDSYPNYDEVNEFDTLVIQLKQGSYLMQFYHSRWRRANDV